jgi:hypothetical protein
VGQEALCRVRFDGQIADGKATLETTDLFFRGDLRLNIPLDEITTLEAEDGELRVAFTEGIAIFELGRDAAKWADKIRNPRTLIDKLGVRQDSVVAVLGVYEENFVRELTRRVLRYSEDALVPNADFIFYGADQREELALLPELRDHLKPTGALWVVSLKGPSAFIRDTDVITAGRASGLVDTKVVSFSETHTAIKFMIPRSAR